MKIMIIYINRFSQASLVGTRVGTFFEWLITLKNVGTSQAIHFYLSLICCFGIGYFDQHKCFE